MIEIEQLKSAIAMSVTLNHELNQPLMIIQGNLDLINFKLDIKKNNIDKHYQKINKAMSRINRILQEIQKIDKINYTQYSEKTEMLNIKKMKPVSKKRRLS